MKDFILATLVVAIAVGALCATFGPKAVLQTALAPVVAGFESLYVLSMKPAMKSVIALAPVSTTNGATQTAAIDRLGFDHLSLDVGATTADVVSNKYSVCKLSHSDTTDATNYSDIAKFVAGGTGGFTLANANTSSAYAVKFNVDLRAFKRYIKLTVSPRTTQTLWAHGQLQHAEQMPIIAADAGVNTLVEG